MQRIAADFRVTDACGRVGEIRVRYLRASAGNLCSPSEGHRNSPPSVATVRETNARFARDTGRGSTEHIASNQRDLHPPMRRPIDGSPRVIQAGHHWTASATSSSLIASDKFPPLAALHVVAVDLRATEFSPRRARSWALPFFKVSERGPPATSHSVARRSTATCCHTPLLAAGFFIPVTTSYATAPRTSGFSPPPFSFFSVAASIFL